MIDFHCHLDLYPQGLALAQETNERNQFTLVVTTSPRAYRATSRVFSGLRNVHVAVGLHPEVAEEKFAELDALIAGVAAARFVGEIGLDGSPRFRRTLPLQERVFRAALGECAAQGGRILSIHSRGAEQRVVELLALHPRSGVPVLHWFSGSLGALHDATRLGCWFSVGPAMVAGAKGRSLLARMPAHRVLPETDGPFASSQGQPLMPWDAWTIGPVLAQIWDQPLAVVEAQLTANLKNLLAQQ